MLLFADTTELCQRCHIYEHLRTVDGIKHNTFKDECIAMGLLTNDNEWHEAWEEANI
jgi:hypothetical protein